MGAWAYVHRRLYAAMREMWKKVRVIHYVGRPASASPATASFQIHQKEVESIIEDVFDDNN